MKDTLDTAVLATIAAIGVVIVCLLWEKIKKDER